MRSLSRRILVITFTTAACSVAVAAALAASAAAQEGGPPAAPSLRQIPGVTAPDQFPRGCVDCHGKPAEAGRDVRISTLMQQWQVEVAPALLEKVRAFSPADKPLKGVHPKIKGEISEIEIPKACMTCHAEKSKIAPPFGRLLHGLHLVGGEKNHFLSVFQGECTHCHKLDAATGSWSLGSGTEKQ